MAQNRKYEAIIILDDVTKEEVDTVKTDLVAAIEKKEIAITSKEEWGSRKLYNSEKIDTGYFYYLTFDAKPEAIALINKDFLVNQHIIKSIITRV